MGTRRPDPWTVGIVNDDRLHIDIDGVHAPSKHLAKEGKVLYFRVSGFGPGCMSRIVFVFLETYSA